MKQPYVAPALRFSFNVADLVKRASAAQSLYVNFYDKVADAAAR